MMDFRIDKDIGGFRTNVTDMTGKEPDKEITSDGPKLYEYPQRISQATFGGKNLITVGEIWGATTKTTKFYSSPKRGELSMIF